MKAYRKMCYNFNEFFILFSLIPLSVSSSFFFLKHRSVPSYFLIPSYFPPTPTPNPTPTHQFHIDADADANANASLPHRSLSNCGFCFFFFFGCGLMGGLGNGWLQMDRSVVGGFGWADRRPPRSTAHLTLSDQIALFFFFFLVDVGWVSWVLMGWCWWVMAVGGLIFTGCDGWCWWVWADFGFWLILDFSYGGRW